MDRRMYQTPPRPPRFPFAGLLVAGVLSLVALGLAVKNSGWLDGPRADANPRPVTARGDLAADEKATIELFEQCSKSVVYVRPTVRRVRRTVFGRYNVEQTGTGSGYVWDQDGHIVTNYHVIHEASSCLVTMPDNSTYDAVYVGGLPDKDIAVLRISAPKQKLFPVAIGTSNDLRVGQKVFAIGNPFGLDFTLTTGVISALNREIKTTIARGAQRTIQGVIQTDAAINPGNSGGPLLDSAGRLVGMNTAIYSETGGSAGIGFAVPVNTINRVVPQLIAHGKVVRPGLGINPAPEVVQRRLRLEGVLIFTVAAGSAAEKAGLRPTTESRTGRIILGDIITHVGDTETPDLDTLLNALEEYEIGQTVQITVVREGASVIVPVTLQRI